MKSILEILVVNEKRTGNKDGRPWEMQDAECVLRNDDGTAAQVGVLQIPKDLRGVVQPGVYIGTFALRPDMASRRINAVLTGLQPYAFKGTPAAKPAGGQ